MKILVTGASGFLGNYVVKELLKHDFNVVATAIEKAKNLKFSWLKKVEYIQADTNTPVKNWHRYFHEPDIIIHLAWQGLPNYKEMFHMERNLPINYLFLKNLLDNGLKKIVGIGTCLEYGMQSGALKEDLDTMPDNPYAQAKDDLRKKIDSLRYEMGFSFTWIRLFYIYGK
ncbi:MAG: NAD(P)-dependent oxidoreductase [Bacteroidales bacterium]|nr:NAD(P)-dependent oxidoreductase [Bacteroidales bacterium]